MYGESRESVPLLSWHKAQSWNHLSYNEFAPLVRSKNLMTQTRGQALQRLIEMEMKKK